MSLLNVNQAVNAICAGRLNEEDDKDILLIGTASNILAYHVENNSDIFYKEVSLFYLLFMFFLIRCT